MIRSNVENKVDASKEVLCCLYLRQNRLFRAEVYDEFDSAGC